MSRVVDGREMTPPEPLGRTLTALDTLVEGEERLLLEYCHPKSLLDVLNRSGYAWQEVVRDDGTHEIRIHRKSVVSQRYSNKISWLAESRSILIETVSASN